MSKLVEEVNYATLPVDKELPVQSAAMERVLGEVKVRRKCKRKIERAIERYILDCETAVGRSVDPRVKTYLRMIPGSGPIRSLVLGQSPYSWRVLPAVASAFAFSTSVVGYVTPSVQVLSQFLVMCAKRHKNVDLDVADLVTVLAKSYICLENGVCFLNVNCMIPENDTEEVKLSIAFAELIIKLQSIYARLGVSKMKVYCFGKVASDTMTWSHRSEPVSEGTLTKMTIVRIEHPASIARSNTSVGSCSKTPGPIPPLLDKTGKIVGKRGPGGIHVATYPWIEYEESLLSRMASHVQGWSMLSDITVNSVNKATLVNMSQKHLQNTSSSEDSSYEAERGSSGTHGKGKGRANMAEKGKGRGRRQGEGKGEAAASGGRAMEGDEPYSYLFSVIKSIDDDTTDFSVQTKKVRDSAKKLAAAAKKLPDGAGRDVSDQLQSSVTILEDCIPVILGASAFISSLRSTLQGTEPMAPSASGTVPPIVGRTSGSGATGPSVIKVSSVVESRGAAVAKSSEKKVAEVGKKPVPVGEKEDTEGGTNKGTKKGVREVLGGKKGVEGKETDVSSEEESEDSEEEEESEDSEEEEESEDSEEEEEEEEDEEEEGEESSDEETEDSNEENEEEKRKEGEEEETGKAVVRQQPSSGDGTSERLTEHLGRLGVYNEPKEPEKEAEERERKKKEEEEGKEARRLESEKDRLAKQMLKDKQEEKEAGEKARRRSVSSTEIPSSSPSIQRRAPVTPSKSAPVSRVPSTSSPSSSSPSLRIPSTASTPTKAKESVLKVRSPGSPSTRGRGPVVVKKA